MFAMAMCVISYVINVLCVCSSCLCLLSFMVTVARPIPILSSARGYDGTYNYFDPDNFFTLSAIMYSGEPYLLNQAKTVIERTGSFIKRETGQLPHHFVTVKPYYLALSGETQTGPNTFWTKVLKRYLDLFFFRSSSSSSVVDDRSFSRLMQIFCSRLLLFIPRRLL
jgi:hypothetical protein